jgi:hypothetical protein
MRVALAIQTGLAFFLATWHPCRAKDTADDLRKLCQERVELARKRADAVETHQDFGWRYQIPTNLVPNRPDPMRFWGRALLLAELALCQDKPSRVKAYEAYWKRMQKFERYAWQLFKAGKILEAEYLKAKGARLEAGMWLCQENDPSKVKARAKERLETARKGLAAMEEQVKDGKMTPSDQSFVAWPRRVLEAQLAMSPRQAERVRCHRVFVKFKAEIERLAKVQAEAGKIGNSLLWEAQFERLGAEIALKKEQGVNAIKALAEARLTAARKVLTVLEDLTNADRLTIDSLPWSRHVLDAQLALQPTKAEVLRACEDHFKRTKKVEEKMSDLAKAGRVRTYELVEARYYRADAEIMLLQAKGNSK